VLRAQLLKVENLYDPKYVDFLHHINQGLKAHEFFQRRGLHRQRREGDQSMSSRAGSCRDGAGDGLHQALEAKENVKIERNQTLATVTFQNYFGMQKLAGTTSTAGRAMEFKKTYNLVSSSYPRTNRSSAPTI
jgi:preprotein translocase subunit SecA